MAAVDDLLLPRQVLLVLQHKLPDDLCQHLQWVDRWR